MSEYTPGPWHVFPQIEPGKMVLIVTDSEIEKIAYVGFTGRPILADAQLIAAAPELLAALENILVLAEVGWMHAHPDTKVENTARLQAARAAIDKATARRHPPSRAGATTGGD